LPTRVVLGVGFLADGRVAGVAAHERIIYAVNEDGSVSVFCDLSSRLKAPANEIMAAPGGGLYVGPMGFDVLRGDKPVPARLLHVQPSGSIREVGCDLHFPNGMAIAPDGPTLLVAESDANRITAFRMNADGALDDGRVYIDLAGNAEHPDGICVDREGSVWCACPRTAEVVRFSRLGEVQQRLFLGDAHPTSCVLGGDDRQMLIITATTEMPSPDMKFSGKAVLLAVRADVPGVG
jgi:sugar lactone lactonase YvrE